MKFKNTNGKTYKIIEHKKAYTLLEEIGGTYQPFVVAWDLSLEHGGWGNGRYCSTLEIAKETFDDLTKD